MKYAEEHPEKFTPAVIESLRQHLSDETGRPDARLSTNVRIQRKPGDFIRLYAEVRNKLKHMRITNHEQIRQMFLHYDKDRTGFITRNNIADIFRQINLPLENDLIDAVIIKKRKILFFYFSDYLFRWLLNAQRTVKERLIYTNFYDFLIVEINDTHKFFLHRIFVIGDKYFLFFPFYILFNCQAFIIFYFHNFIVFSIK